MYTKKPKLLFILKKRSSYGVSYGLINSCQFVAAALEKYGVESVIEQVIDNNCIDRAVRKHNPTHVIIEALWVVPEKFPVLIKLHPRVKWYVRLHSQTPFLGYEGIAFQWIREYHRLEQYGLGPTVMCNHKKLVNDLSEALYIPSVYAPNIYTFNRKRHKKKIEDNVVHIGCFGAIRPFKNLLNQALGAIIFANGYGLHLHFHINASRFENHGEAILKNLRNIFKCSPHSLIEHDWSNHDDFIRIVKKMDFGLQVSYTETFNIVGADFVANNVPLVGSHEIDWLSHFYKADPTNAEDIAAKLVFAFLTKKFNVQKLNEIGLEKHNEDSIDAWIELIKRK